MGDRIQLNDNIIDAIKRIAGGNPGALSVCIKLVNEGKAIDPLAAFGGFTNILSLDTNRIYESQIWVLFKDVCGGNIVNVVAILRARQLGLVADGQIFDKGRDWASLIEQIRAEIGAENFAPGERVVNRG